jgi:hypothetical protein
MGEECDAFPEIGHPTPQCSNAGDRGSAPARAAVRESGSRRVLTALAAADCKGETRITSRVNRPRWCVGLLLCETA